MRNLSSSGVTIKIDEEGEAVVSARILTSPLDGGSVRNAWVVCIASNHVVVRELLEWKDVDDAWRGCGLDIADELVVIGGERWSNAD